MLVNNASTDTTVEVARVAWTRLGAPSSLRVEHEPRKGQAFARERGLLSARYDTTIFCDDDNALAPDYVAAAHRTLLDHPNVGVVGGKVVYGGEATPPAWFESHANAYAIGEQGPTVGGEVEGVFGSGMTVRTIVARKLWVCGYRPFVTGRIGAGLIGGDDTELWLMYRLAGFKVRYEPRLKLSHRIQPDRLTLDYLKRLHRGFGAGRAQLIPIIEVLQGRKKRPLLFARALLYARRQLRLLALPPTSLSDELRQIERRSYYKAICSLNVELDRRQRRVEGVLSLYATLDQSLGALT